MVIEEEKGDKQQVVLKDTIPLEIKAENMIDNVNKKKEDMDDKDMGDNIIRKQLRETCPQSI